MAEKDNIGCLFSSEEMTRAMGGFDFKEDQPVTVLGITFENDAKRREYFREELRKKLPELRHIEGFPIGSDDDIINLSDPPYYTACPNPWLNDFIQQWEEEKKQLEAEGKRQPNVVVNEPYAADVREGKNNPVYTAHPYHTKVPHPAIMRFIMHYTQPGDIIFDGFSGTGMTGVAAASCADSNSEYAQRISEEFQKAGHKRPVWGARHAICGDLSPYASNIAYIYNTPVDTSLLKSEVNRIKKELEKECGWLYQTTDSKGQKSGRVNFMLWSDVMTCPFCGNDYVYWDNGITMDSGRVTALDSYKCPHCGASQSKKNAKPSVESYFDDGIGKVAYRIKQVPVIVVGKAGSEKIQRAPNKFDLQLLEKIEAYKIPHWYPTTELPEGLKTKDPKSREVYYVHQFYTKRSLIALSALYNLIEESPISHVLRFLFTSLLNLISKRNRVQAKNPYSRGQGVLALTLVLPPLPTEASLLEMIDMRLNSILKAIEDIPQAHVNAQYVSSADNLTIKDDSIDYIFTDPPFGANINYSELNSMPEPWLKVMTNNGHEAIINEYQDKNEQTYRDTMYRCFSEFNRVLKPGKWMTVEFSNTSASVWNSIQTSLQRAGFVVANVAALDKGQGGMNANMTTTAVKQDLAISCYKPSEQLNRDAVLHGDISVWDFVDDYLAHLSFFKSENDITSLIPERDQRILYDKVIAFFVQNGVDVPIDSLEFQAGLRERYVERDGMFFTALQAVKYDELRKHSGGFQSNIFFIDSEQGGIAWLKNELSTPQTYQELQPKWLQAINGMRKGDIVPEPLQILEENFIKEPDGKWRKPNLQDDVDLEALRTKSLLREFKVYVEMAQKPKAKIKEARVEALRAGFKQCYIDKKFQTIVTVGDKIPQNLLTEDEVLLQFYDIAQNKL
jgi:DNA modification methylase